MIRDGFYLCHKKQTEKLLHQDIQHTTFWPTQTEDTSLHSLWFDVVFVIKLNTNMSEMYTSTWQEDKHKSRQQSKGTIITVESAHRHVRNRKPPFLKRCWLRTQPDEIYSVQAFPDHCYHRSVTAEDNICFLTGTWPSSTVQTWEHGTYAGLLQISISEKRSEQMLHLTI